MNIVRCSPFGGVSELQNEINRLFSNWDDPESSGATAGWVPTVDIQEFDNRFQLYIDLSGVEPSDVNVTLDNGVLTITGERSLPSAPKTDSEVTHRSERGHGHFHRRLILPDTVDSENVKATGRNGVLEISIPKQAKAWPRRINVAA
jgi:HSP20 family protein